MKGQYFSFDAIIASIIFILTFMALMTYWFSVKSSLETKEELINAEAGRIADSMLTPSYLTDSYLVPKVNKSRLFALLSPRPDEPDYLKSTFSSPYNLSISISELQNGEMQETEGFGSIPANAKNVAKVRRTFVLYDGISESIAALDLYLYE